MNYLFAPLIGLIIMVLNVFAPLLMLLALPFIKWDDKPTDGVVRGDLPGWLSWLSTPDERLPGGLYEPAHLALYEKWGKWVASWYWLGVRNSLFGLSSYFGKDAIGYMPEMVAMTGLWERPEDGVWQYGARLGSLKFACGYKVYKLLDGSFRAFPCFTVMNRPL
jgi:hypothetical protein